MFKTSATLSAAAVLLLCGCSDILFPEKGEGELEWAFRYDLYDETKATGRNASIPDTNDFILNVQNSAGKEIYSGTYGESPEKIDVEPGSYTINAISQKFTVPKFSCPQYGDTKVVTVSAGKTTKVKLDCRLVNSGVKLNIDENFLTAYPNGALLLKSAEGKLAYCFTEKRIAYFNPGAVSLILTNDGKDEVLLTRTLASQQILTIGISAGGNATSGEGGASISLDVDTTAVYLNEDFVIGGGSSAEAGSTKETAFNITAIRSHVGAKAVWVYGYIVGGDLSSGAKGISFDAPFKSNTNIAIASRSSVSTKESCISVALTKGSIRDNLNLPDHPDLLGRRVYLQGDIVESYYGIVGIKEISDFVLK
ncbi:MAG: DUF4493 domain-containing protein [Bacteroidales bacterium]|nr:DUF4493 domain-containing protein [Bacteroidales bacterium]